MSQRRKPKQGYVYLLKNINENEHQIYKFGCTTLTPEKRCSRVNSECKKYNYNFVVIASFKSFDIYKDEHTVRQNILQAGMGMLSEVFTSDVDDCLNSDSDVINRFLQLGGVIKKGYLL
jgi:hypothetical protein